MEEKSLDYKELVLHINPRKNTTRAHFLPYIENLDKPIAYLSNNNFTYMRNPDFKVNAKMNNYFTNSEEDDIKKSIKIVEKDIVKIQDMLPVISEIMLKADCKTANHLKIEKGEVYKVYDFSWFDNTYNSTTLKVLHSFNILGKNTKIYSVHENLKEATINLMNYYKTIGFFEEIGMEIQGQISIMPRKQTTLQ